MVRGQGELALEAQEIKAVLFMSGQGQVGARVSFSGF